MPPQVQLQTRFWILVPLFSSPLQLHRWAADSSAANAPLVSWTVSLADSRDTVCGPRTWPFRCTAHQRRPTVHSLSSQYWLLWPVPAPTICRNISRWLSDGRIISMNNETGRFCVLTLSRGSNYFHSPLEEPVEWKRSARRGWRWYHAGRCKVSKQTTH